MLVIAVFFFQSFLSLKLALLAALLVAFVFLSVSSRGFHHPRVWSLFFSVFAAPAICLHPGRRLTMLFSVAYFFCAPFSFLATDRSHRSSKSPPV